MTRILVLLAVLGIPVTAQSKGHARNVSQRPDVILVTFDTLRADRIGCYGYALAQTPNLDRLCKQGVKFENAFTASPITNTSHASILTGLYPSRHGVADFAIPLAPTHATLAEQLRKNGYQTAAFIGAVILDSSTLAPGFQRGFDHYQNFPEKSNTKQRWERVERRAEAVVGKAITWLNAHAQGPRFLWLHLYDPHDPYEAPEPFRSKFIKSPYDGEVAYADGALGRLTAALERQARWNNALMVVMSDHGEGLGQHGENTHGIFLYDSTLRIPIIFKLPGNVRANSKVNAQVSSVDVMPTILDLLAIPVPKVDGVSLKAALVGEASEDHVVFAETDYPLRFGWAPLKAIRKGSKKYIEAPRPEFYDLTADPGESINTYQPWSEGVQRLRGELAEFRKNAPQPAQPKAAAVDPNTIAELKALGYLGTDPGATTVAEPSMLPDPKDKIEIQNLIHSGMMHDESGDAAAARIAFARAAKADPTSFIALAQLGTLEFRAGDYKSAAQHLSAAYAIRPQDASVVSYLGQTLERTGDHTAARSILENALKQNPGQFDARMALGRVYRALGNMPAAADQFEAAIFVDGKRAAARLELARILLQQGRKKEAIEQLRRAEALDPGNAETRELLQQAK